MPATLRKRLFQVGSFVLAGGLLYLALRDVDFAEVGGELKTAHWWWLAPMAAVMLVAHWLRAWRWTLFLDALPPDVAGPKRVSVRSAFEALMIGYMVNYATPRLGEVVRTANVSSRYGARFSSVLGTVVVERLFDVIVMGLALLTVPLIFADRLDPVRDMLLGPTISWAESLPVGILTAVAIVVFVAGFLVFRRLVLADTGGVGGRVRRAVESFSEGFKGLLRTPHRVTLVGTTLAMWACYGLLAHLPFMMFGFDKLYGITLIDSWGLMLIGAIGIALPSPGGVGTYHYITIQTLVILFGFPTADAATYALVTHAGQLILYVTVGFAALMRQGGGLAAILRTTPEAARPD